jgi:hypothetical protein
MNAPLQEQFQVFTTTHPNLCSLWLTCLRKQETPPLLAAAYSAQAKKVLLLLPTLSDLHVGQIALLQYFSQSPGTL